MLSSVRSIFLFVLVCFSATTPLTPAALTRRAIPALASHAKTAPLARTLFVWGKKRIPFKERKNDGSESKAARPSHPEVGYSVSYLDPVDQIKVSADLLELAKDAISAAKALPKLENMYPDFVASLRSQYPDATPQELLFRWYEKVVIHAPRAADVDDNSDDENHFTDAE